MIEYPIIVAQPRWLEGRTGMYPPSRGLLKPIIIVAIPLVIVLLTLAGYVEKWLWMRQLGYAGIFWTLLSVQWEMFCAAFVFAFLYLWINLRLAARNGAASARMI